MFALRHAEHTLGNGLRATHLPDESYPHMVEDDRPVMCCPGAERIDDLETRKGLPVFDVHRHKGLLRGFVHEGEKRRLLHWYRNGRLGRGAEHTHDLRRVR